MARVKKPADSWHRIRVRNDDNDGELLLVKGGRRAYLWVGKDVPENGNLVFSGKVALRRLAKEILREVKP